MRWILTLLALLAIEAAGADDAQMVKLSRDPMQRTWTLRHSAPAVAVEGRPEIHYLGLARVSCFMVVGESTPPSVRLIISLRRAADVRLWAFSEKAVLALDGGNHEVPLEETMTVPVLPGPGHEESGIIRLSPAETNALLAAATPVVKIGPDEIPLPAAALHPLRRVIDRYRAELAAGTFREAKKTALR